MRAILLALALALASPVEAQVEARTSRTHYDHREPEDRTADESWRWIARIVLAPAAFFLSLMRESTRLVLEPIDGGSSSGGEAQPWSLLPIIQLETEVSPAVGAAFTLAGGGARLDLSFAHWDDARVEGRARLAQEIDDASIELEGDASTRGDRIFHGDGASTNDDRRRYRHHRGGGTLAWRQRFFRSSELALSMRATHHRIAESRFAGEEALSIQGEGATVIEPRFELAIDTRERRIGAGNGGVAVSMVAAGANDLEHGAWWTRSEASAEMTVAFLREHDVTFGVWGAWLEAIDGEIPFVERAILGGTPGRFAGFPYGRFIGHTAWLTTARYRWGIFQHADASLCFELGDALGPRFDGFAIERARLSAAFVIDGLATDDHRFGFLVGMGTAPIAAGLAPESGHVRLFVGSPDP